MVLRVYFRVSAICTLVLLTANLLFADDVAKARKAIDEATTDYEKRHSELVSKLLATFDEAERIVANGGGKLKLSTEDKVAMLELLAKERKRFEKNEGMPLSIYMRRATENYLVAENELLGKLANTYNRAIKTVEKKSPDLLKDLIAERDEKTAPVPVATWKYTWAPDRTSQWRLMSDGTFGDGKCTWKIVGDTLVMQGRDLVNLKASIWTDKCALSVDGTKMDGTNQLGHQKYGTRID